jgi:hypothetical protein
MTWILHNVKIGSFARNLTGTIYTREAIENALHMYDGLPVNLDTAECECGAVGV